MSVYPTARLTPPDALDEILAGGLGALAVRAVAIAPASHGLRELLDARLPGARLVAVELLRTKYKPARKLTAYYRLTLGHDRTGDPGNTGNADVRQVAVSWSVQQPPALLVSPEDPAMPALRRLCRPTHLATMLAEMTARPVECPSRLGVRTIRYRPGQRHVLYVGCGPRRPGVFVKTDRDDCGARAVPVAEELGPPFRMRAPGVRLVEPVGYSTHDRAAVWQAAAGEPLWTRLTDSTADAVRLVARVGQALRVLHDGRAPAGTRAHDVHTEAASTLRAGEHIAALLPAAGATYGALVSDVVGRLDQLPAEAPGFAHGDVKCDNLLVDGDQIRILDLDRTCLADPALDLGKFVADLRWWCRDDPRVPVLCTALRAGYGPCEPARWARAGLLAVLFQLKLAARRCAVHDPDWATQVEERIAGAAATLATAAPATERSR